MEIANSNKMYSEEKRSIERVCDICWSEGNVGDSLENCAKCWAVAHNACISELNVEYNGEYYMCPPCRLGLDTNTLRCGICSRMGGFLLECRSHQPKQGKYFADIEASDIKNENADLDVISNQRREFFHFLCASQLKGVYKNEGEGCLRRKIPPDAKLKKDNPTHDISTAIRICELCHGSQGILNCASCKRKSLHLVCAIKEGHYFDLSTITEVDKHLGENGVNGINKGKENNKGEWSARYTIYCSKCSERQKMNMGNGGNNIINEENKTGAHTKINGEHKYKCKPKDKYKKQFATVPKSPSKAQRAKDKSATKHKVLRTASEFLNTFESNEEDSQEETKLRRSNRVTKKRIYGSTEISSDKLSEPEPDKPIKIHHKKKVQQCEIPFQKPYGGTKAPDILIDIINIIIKDLDSLEVLRRRNSEYGIYLTAQDLHATGKRYGEAYYKICEDKKLSFILPNLNFSMNEEEKMRDSNQGEEINEVNEVDEVHEVHKVHKVLRRGKVSSVKKQKPRRRERLNAWKLNKMEYSNCSNGGETPMFDDISYTRNLNDQIINNFSSEDDISHTSSPLYFPSSHGSMNFVVEIDDSDDDLGDLSIPLTQHQIFAEQLLREIINSAIALSTLSDIGSNLAKSVPMESPQPVNTDQDEQILKYFQIPTKKVNYEEQWITNIDNLMEKTVLEHYITFREFMNDIEALFRYVLKRRCLNNLGSIYVSNILNQTIKLLLRKNTEERYDNQKMEDYMQIIESHFGPEVQGSWNKEPYPKRNYFPLTKYESGIEGDNSPIEALSTTLEGKCDGKYCSNLDFLGPLDPVHEIWETKCIHRSRKIECSEHCKCKGECCNRAITDNKPMVMGKDVREIDSWGIDIMTSNRIVNVLPNSLTLAHKLKFIEVLNHAFQTQGRDASDIKKSLSYIKDNIKNTFNILDINIAEFLKRVIDRIPDSIEPFKVHSKGLGIICTRKTGFYPNEFIQEYFGEIYPPWRWYEKQDIIKQGQKKGKLSEDLPDFYNISLERHKTDPLGYGVMHIDPINKGSFCSRFSHSCKPNCATTVMVANKQYCVAMYAIEKIEYGQELTFNYHSVTESEKEHKSAVCLCSATNCQGYYLKYGNPNIFTQIINTQQAFLDRTYLIFKAVINTEITIYDIARLKKHGIGVALLGSHPPPWLRKWAVLVLQFIEYEEIQLAKYLREKESYEIRMSKIEATDVAIGRVTNLAITLDKVRHLLEKMGTQDPPINIVSPKNIFMNLWRRQHSMKDTLHETRKIIKNDIRNNKYTYDMVEFDRLLDSKICEEKECEEEGSYEGVILMPDETNNEETIPTIIRKKAENDKSFYERVNEEVRFRLRELSKIVGKLRKIESIHVEHLADFLFLYSQIETYFTSNQAYTKVISDGIKIRKCDVTSDAKHNSLITKSEMSAIIEATVVYEGTKEYDPSFIWGQLSGWFKQTVDKPNASLSAERRGTLSYPDLECFIANSTGPDNHHGGPDTRRIAKRTSEHETSETDMDDKKPDRPYAKTYQKIHGAKRSSNYPKGLSRVEFFERVRRQPSHLWPTGNYWSYKNNKRMYGSVQFDSIRRADIERHGDRTHHLSEVLQTLYTL